MVKNRALLLYMSSNSGYLLLLWQVFMKREGMRQAGVAGRDPACLRDLRVQSC